ncbi:MAG: prepilin-type N-terminal cleavage/methylation domain-containing protein [Azoarcus sp.]|jgi:hypothetical protein|nr:prepilin-type N-terminal cleavage/methylation domain-containing protein [Azoarcus sp.]
MKPRISRPRTSAARAQRGLTLIELMVCCLLALFLFLGYLRATRHYQEEMEEISVRLTISRIQVGMALEWARRISTNENRQGIEELAGANPVRWLDEPPYNYLGELKAPRLEKLEPGRWLFDLSRKELVYIVDNGDNLTLKNSFEGVKALRWSVRLAAESGEEKNTAPEFGELKLVPVHEYRWF